MNLLTALVVAGLAAVPQHPGMPPGMSHEEHLKQMEQDAALKKRGAAAMGFDQDAAVHHFRVMATGGAIEVEARRKNDETTRAQIRAHLQQIAVDFAKGDFGKPVATHAETPPGVAGLQEHRASINYRYEETRAGARVMIETRDRDALEAVHAFLRYQIHEHKTGDSAGTARDRREEDAIRF
jgi:hypothetical protein